MNENLCSSMNMRRVTRQYRNGRVLTTKSIHSKCPETCKVEINMRQWPRLSTGWYGRTWVKCESCKWRESTNCERFFFAVLIKLYIVSASSTAILWTTVAIIKLTVYLSRALYVNKIENVKKFKVVHVDDVTSMQKKGLDSIKFYSFWRTRKTQMTTWQFFGYAIAGRYGITGRHSPRNRELLSYAAVPISSIGLIMDDTDLTVKALECVRAFSYASGVPASQKVEKICPAFGKNDVRHSLRRLCQYAAFPQEMEW